MADLLHRIRRVVWKCFGVNDKQGYCFDCGLRLTKDEAIHYEFRCERCEGIAFHTDERTQRVNASDCTEPNRAACPRWRGGPQAMSHFTSDPDPLGHSDDGVSAVDEVVACLGDDAAQLRDENPEDERAANMDRAASMLQRMCVALRRIATIEPAEGKASKNRGAMLQMQAIARAALAAGVLEAQPQQEKKHG